MSASMQTYTVFWRQCLFTTSRFFTRFLASHIISDVFVKESVAIPVPALVKNIHPVFEKSKTMKTTKSFQIECLERREVFSVAPGLEVLGAYSGEPMPLEDVNVSLVAQRSGDLLGMVGPSDEENFFAASASSDNDRFLATPGSDANAYWSSLDLGFRDSLDAAAHDAVLGSAPKLFG